MNPKPKAIVKSFIACSGSCKNLPALLTKDEEISPSIASDKSNEYNPDINFIVFILPKSNSELIPVTRANINTFISISLSKLTIAKIQTKQHAIKEI